MNLLEEAILFATHAHEGQIRKRAGHPYILHPMEVASILATMTNDLDVLSAGILHDTVEDCGVSLDTLREKFGDRVAALVQSETEDKLKDRPPEETWKERKLASLAVLRETDDRGVKMLWLADKLSNMRSFARQHRVTGDKLWEHFHQKDPAVQAWYYHEVAACMTDLYDTDAYREYNTLLCEVFGG